MFQEFTSQVWTPEDATVVAANNTDTSIDGSCKKVVWASGINKYIDIAFDSVNLSLWEEISIYIYMRDILATGTIFTINIGGTDFDFTREEAMPGNWTQLLFDCSSMGSVSDIKITSKVNDLTLMIDYAGYRKVTYNSDIDIINALKSHINLNYDVTTYLTSDVSIGAESIQVASKAYITDTSILEIDDGYGNIETVALSNKDGALMEPLTHNFSTGDEVRVICPIRSEDYDSLEPDPVCGIKIYDISVDKDPYIEKSKNSAKFKQFLGALGIAVYIDCNSKKKLLQLVREYNKKYGKEFQILLDGDQVDIHLDSSVFADVIIGNNPRMVYYYRIVPQAAFYANATSINTINLTMAPVAP